MGLGHYLGGDATADAIMDRLVHTSEQIELKGKSLRAGRLEREVSSATN